MNIKEKAKLFAIKAHKGQIRKSEPDKPMIMHPIGVGKLLETFGYDDNVIAAGYLHDVVEDTKYSIEDIEKEFGSDIASLVNSASEPDKSLSWEERKKHTIQETKKLPLRNKLVICADKINNLESLYTTFEKSGKRDFQAFKKGEELQKWYYESVYESLVTNEDQNLPIFKRLKSILEKTFHPKEDMFLKENIFEGEEEHYRNLRRFHAYKQDLYRIKQLCKQAKPYIIEFSGTPRSGKTSLIKNLEDFFQKGGFQVSYEEEFRTSKECKEMLKTTWKDLSYYEIMEKMEESIFNRVQNRIQENPDILLIDRGLNDRLIWNQRGYLMGKYDESSYLRLKEKYNLWKTNDRLSYSFLYRSSNCIKTRLS